MCLYVFLFHLEGSGKFSPQRGIFEQKAEHSIKQPWGHLGEEWPRQRAYTAHTETQGGIKLGIFQEFQGDRWEHSEQWGEGGKVRLMETEVKGLGRLG